MKFDSIFKNDRKDFWEECLEREKRGNVKSLKYRDEDGEEKEKRREREREREGEREREREDEEDVIEWSKYL